MKSLASSALWTAMWIGVLASMAVVRPVALAGEFEDFEALLRQEKSAGRITQAYYDRALVIARELQVEARRIGSAPGLTEEARTKAAEAADSLMFRLASWEAIEELRGAMGLDGQTTLQASAADDVRGYFVGAVRTEAKRQVRRIMDPIRESGPRATRNGAIPLDELLQASRTRARFALAMDADELEGLKSVDPTADGGRAQVCQSSPDLATAWEIGTYQAFSGKRYLEKHHLFFTQIELQACIEMIPEYENRDQIPEISTQRQRQARYCCQQGFRRGQEAFQALVERTPTGSGEEFAACREEYGYGRAHAEITVCRPGAEESSCGTPADPVWAGCMTTGFLAVGRACERARQLAAAEERARIFANREAPEGPSASTGSSAAPHAPTAGAAR